jgi:hypothetical protein
MQPDGFADVVGTVVDLLFGGGEFVGLVQTVSETVAGAFQVGLGGVHNKII